MYEHMGGKGGSGDRLIVDRRQQYRRRSLPRRAAAATAKTINNIRARQINDHNNPAAAIHLAVYLHNVIIL